MNLKEYVQKHKELEEESQESCRRCAENKKKWKCLNTSVDRRQLVHEWLQEKDYQKLGSQEFFLYSKKSDIFGIDRDYFFAELGSFSQEEFLRDYSEIKRIEKKVKKLRDRSALVSLWVLVGGVTGLLYNLPITNRVPAAATLSSIIAFITAGTIKGFIPLLEYHKFEKEHEKMEEYRNKKYSWKYGNNALEELVEVN